LAAADFLDPQPDDHFELGAQHHDDVGALFQILQYHHRNNLLLSVLPSVKLKWGVAGQPEPTADVAIVSNLVEPQRRRKILDVAREGIRPSCIIEVIAPRFAEMTLVNKRQIYEKAGIQEYIVIDSGLRADTEQQASAICYGVSGYELVNGQYVALPLDEEQRVYSAVNRVRFGPNAQNSGFEVIDARTGQPIQPQTVIDHDRAAASQGERRGHDLGASLDFLRMQGGE
ncbi:MAG: Uma2 family endonuclease, partial [Caldilineaceae bacterium]|nr:Uma2 family endonuclease [Caldilineaceae bacterium]